MGLLDLSAAYFFVRRHLPSITARTSSSFMIRYSSPSSLISWPEYLPNRIVSPALTSSGDALAVVVDLAVPGGDDRALLRLFFGGVRDDDPADLLFAFVEALNDDAVV